MVLSKSVERKFLAVARTGSLPRLHLRSRLISLRQVSSESSQRGSFLEQKVTLSGTERVKAMKERKRLGCTPPRWRQVDETRGRPGQWNLATRLPPNQIVSVRHRNRPRPSPSIQGSRWRVDPPGQRKQEVERASDLHGRAMVTSFSSYTQCILSRRAGFLLHGIGTRKALSSLERTLRLVPHLSNCLFYPCFKHSWLALFLSVHPTRPTAFDRNAFVYRILFIVLVFRTLIILLSSAAGSF